MTHTEVIQHYIDSVGAKSYLEIGLGDLGNFNAIKCDIKHGVDPDNKKELPLATATEIIFRMPSDAFLKADGSSPVYMYDVIFIDGLHHADQVWRDIEGSLNHLNPGGVILVHDINPADYEMTVVPRKTKQWTGNVYKSWYRFNMQAREVVLLSLEDDFGIGVIMPQQGFKLTKAHYKNVTFNDYKEWLKERFTQL